MEPDQYWICLLYAQTEQRKKLFLCTGCVESPEFAAIDHNLGRSEHSQCQRRVCSDDGMKGIWRLMIIVGPISDVSAALQFHIEMTPAVAASVNSGSDPIPLSRCYAEALRRATARGWMCTTARVAITAEEEYTLLAAASQQVADVYWAMHERSQEQQWDQMVVDKRET
jgi:hypothetical protein